MFGSYIQITAMNASSAFDVPTLITSPSKCVQRGSLFRRLSNEAVTLPMFGGRSNRRDNPGRRSDHDGLQQTVQAAGDP
jgi:hypothetical protein